MKSVSPKKKIKREDDSWSEHSWEDNNKLKKDHKKIIGRKECPYLGTIKKHMLDFDFEKLCSISLSNLNVYACLICGKYF